MKKWNTSPCGWYSVSRIRSVLMLILCPLRLCQAYYPRRRYFQCEPAAQIRFDWLKGFTETQRRRTTHKWESSIRPRNNMQKLYPRAMEIFLYGPTRMLLICPKHILIVQEHILSNIICLRRLKFRPMSLHRTHEVS